MYIGLDSSQFESVKWNQALIGIHREAKTSITDNGIVSDTFDSIGTNDKVGLISSIIYEIDDLTT